MSDRGVDVPMDVEDDERAGLDVIDAAIEGGPEPSVEDRLACLLDMVDGALRELLRIQEQLFQIIEWQAERRAQLIEAVTG
jgi:hypothetical protein